MRKRVDPATDPMCELLPQPDEGASPRSSFNGTLLIVIVMFGWLIVVFGMSAAVARNDPNIEVPIPMDRGVVVTPADGWYRADDNQSAGASQVVLQSSGVYATITVDAFQGTSEELMAIVIEQLQSSIDSFRALPGRSISVAGSKQLAAVMVHFSGVASWGNEEGEIVALSHGGTAVVMLAETQAGQLRWVQGDLDTMWQTVEVQ